MTVGRADLLGGKKEPRTGEGSAVSEAPVIIFTITPGRSGTHYLTSLFSVLPEVYAVHEPDPTLSSREFVQGELTKEEAVILINEKADSILATCKNPNASTYVETSHALLSHTSAPSTLIERLLANLNGQSIGVVILKRDLAEVMMSRSHLGHMTRYSESREVRCRGVGWIYTPGSKNAQILPIKPDNQLTQLELLAGYVLNVEAVAGNFAKQYKGHPRLRIYEIDLKDLSQSIGAITGMMDFFHLAYDRKNLTKVMKCGKTNERKEDKDKARVRDKCVVTLDDCEAALKDYRKRLKG